MAEEKKSPSAIDAEDIMSSVKVEIHLGADIFNERVPRIKELINDYHLPDLGSQFALFRIWPFKQLSVPIMMIGRKMFYLYSENQRKGLNLLIRELEIINVSLKYLNNSMVKKTDDL